MSGVREIPKSELERMVSGARGVRECELLFSAAWLEAALHVVL